MLVLFYLSIAKISAKMQGWSRKKTKFILRPEQNNSSSVSAAAADCLATTQGGDLNRQPDWK